MELEPLMKLNIVSCKVKVKKIIERTKQTNIRYGIKRMLQGYGVFPRMKVFAYISNNTLILHDHPT